MKKFCIALVLAAAPISAFAAPAAPAGMAPYEFKLDISGTDTPEGAARVYADIRRQAVRICASLETERHVTKEVRACRSAVAEKAVGAIDKPMVTALWREDDGMRVAAR